MLLRFRKVAVFFVISGVNLEGARGLALILRFLWSPLENLNGSAVTAVLLLSILAIIVTRT